MYPIISGTGCQACGLELVACSFFLFLIFLAKLGDAISVNQPNLTPDPCTKHAGF